MTESPRQLPPPADPALLPVLAGITCIAAIIGLWGILSLVLDRDVIDYPDAGPLLGPVMAMAAGIATWLASWRLRSGQAVVSAAVGSLAGMLLTGAIGYTLSRGDLAWMVLATAHFATSPFVLGAVGLSGLVALGTAALRRPPDRSPSPH